MASGRPPNSAWPPCAHRISSTGTEHLASTLVATDPSTRLTMSPWPREPITTRSNFPSSASLAIDSATCPIVCTNVALIPCYVPQYRDVLAGAACQDEHMPDAVPEQWSSFRKTFFTLPRVLWY